MGVFAFSLSFLVMRFIHLFIRGNLTIGYLGYLLALRLLLSLLTVIGFAILEPLLFSPRCLSPV